VDQEERDTIQAVINQYKDAQLSKLLAEACLGHSHRPAHPFPPSHPNNKYEKTTDAQAGLWPARFLKIPGRLTAGQIFENLNK
jgi:hypothetical protein